MEATRQEDHGSEKVVFAFVLLSLAGSYKPVTICLDFVRVVAAADWRGGLMLP